MSQQWGPPPPRPRDPWDGAPQWNPVQGPHHTMLGTDSSRATALPALWPTVVVTLFFGLFGLIPASIAANRARDLGAPGGRYWRGFGVTFGAVLLAEIAVVSVLAFVIAPTLRDGSLVPTSSRPAAATTPTHVPATDPPAGTPVEPSSRPNASTGTSRLTGSWAGTITQVPGDRRTYTARVRFVGDDAIVRYPELGCSGEWRFIRREGTAYYFVESITQGRDKCVASMPITIVDTGTALSYSFTGERTAGNGMLRRVD